MKKTTFTYSIAAAALAVSTSQAAINFSFNFTDPAGIGFNHSTEGAARQAALNQAAGVVEALFVNYSGTINMSVNGGETGDTTLASAGANRNGPEPAGFTSRGDVGLIILGGADPNAGQADGVVNWNFEDHQWELGNDFQAGEFDFISTAAHELLHAVGFLSNVGDSAVDLTLQDSTDQAANGGIWGPFDQWVGDSTGPLIGQSANYVIDETRLNSSILGGTGTVPATNGLYFHGPNAMAANGGNPVPMYSPATYEMGSSVSHLDDTYFNGTTAPMRMMNSASDTGLGVRIVSPLEIAMLRDIGFTQIVPEPSVGLLIGFSASFLLLRRHRK